MTDLSGSPSSLKSKLNHARNRVFWSGNEPIITIGDRESSKGREYQYISHVTVFGYALIGSCDTVCQRTSRLTDRSTRPYEGTFHKGQSGSRIRPVPVSDCAFYRNEEGYTEFGYTAEDWCISGIFAPFSREAQAHNYLWFIEPSAIASNSCEVHAGRKRIGCRRRTTLVGLVPPEGRPEGESRWDELKRQSSPAIHYQQGHRGLPYMTSEFKGGQGSHGKSDEREAAWKIEHKSVPKADKEGGCKIFLHILTMKALNSSVDGERRSRRSEREGESARVVFLDRPPRLTNYGGSHRP